MNSRLVWLSVALIVIVTVILYQPALSIGFWTDDFWYIEMVGRLSVPDYLRAYFDPALQWRWYRPMQGLQWWLEYVLLRGEPVGYHLIQIILHAFSATMLLLLTKRVTRRLRLGLAAALLYLTVSAYSIAVFQPSVVDPLLAPFYLLTIWFWLGYLDRGGAARYLLTLFMFIAALMTKEVAATLPLTLVLAELWLKQSRLAWQSWVRRYALFFLLLIPYALFELRALSQGLFTQQLGYAPGLHIFSSLAYQLTLLAFPWLPPSDVSLVLVSLVGAFVIYAAVKRKWQILFVISTTLLTLLPVLPFPPGLARNPRYLYLALMGSALLFAGLVVWGLRASERRHWRLAAPVACAVIALVILWSGGTIADAADSFGGAARVVRLSFRPIYDKHPNFAPGTLLYFLAPRVPNISGVMFLRYGKTVAASGTDMDHVASLRDYPAAYLFYLDEENTWRDQNVAKTVSAEAMPSPPARFGDSIQVQALELSGDQVRRGDALIALVYWSAQQKPTRDYTVFAHLVDRDGNIVASVDRPPQEGIAPTSSWLPHALVSDGIVLPIPMNAPLANDLRLEIGMYDSITQERLPVMTVDGQRVDDKIVVAPIQVTE